MDEINLSEHPWLKENGDASEQPIDSAVLIRMKQFRAMNKLKKLALKVYMFTFIKKKMGFVYFNGFFLKTGYCGKPRINRRDKGIETDVQQHGH